MEELSNEVEKQNRQSIQYDTIIKFAALSILVLFFGIYVGQLLFGVNSLEVLINLQTNKVELKDEIIRLKKENAALQKEYFQLEQLSSQ